MRLPLVTFFNETLDPILANKVSIPGNGTSTCPYLHRKRFPIPTSHSAENQNFFAHEKKGPWLDTIFTEARLADRV